jgi:hypothetical protein
MGSSSTSDDVCESAGYPPVNPSIHFPTLHSSLRLRVLHVLDQHKEWIGRHLSRRRVKVANCIITPVHLQHPGLSEAIAPPPAFPETWTCQHVGFIHSVPPRLVLQALRRLVFRCPPPVPARPRQSRESCTAGSPQVGMSWVRAYLESPTVTPAADASELQYDYRYRSTRQSGLQSA